MKRLVLIPALALAVAGAVSVAPAANAANAKNPYGNVNKGNDQGNDTGDAKVDALNAAQLNANYKGPMETRMPAAGSTMPGSTMPGAAPMPPK